jgi:hypothetical protein
MGCYNGLQGMWVDKGCRGVFEVNGVKNVDCACKLVLPDTKQFCSDKFNCSVSSTACKIGNKNVTIVGIDGNGVAVGSHSLIAAAVDPENAAILELVVDVPSKTTGTGDSLYLDGQDVAFIRAQLLDANGILVKNVDENVTYSVVEGPIAIVGVGSGDIGNHQHVQGNTYQTWQGLGRVVVQVTLDCTSANRDLAMEINIDADASAYASACPTAGRSAVLMASTLNGLKASIKIPISGDKKHHPFEVARATSNLDTYTYFEDAHL